MCCEIAMLDISQAKTPLYSILPSLFLYLYYSLSISRFCSHFLFLKLLHSGTDRASPNTNMMWPLVCHEISLSYEQEEKVRGVQRTILSNADCWIHRHTALATRYVIEGVHDVVCGAHAAARKRERSLMQILTPEQRVRFLGWARRAHNGEFRRRRLQDFP